jgi:hypothetical protein
MLSNPGGTTVQAPPQQYTAALAQYTPLKAQPIAVAGAAVRDLQVFLNIL